MNYGLGIATRGFRTGEDFTDTLAIATRGYRIFVPDVVEDTLFFITQAIQLSVPETLNVFTLNYKPEIDILQRITDYSEFISVKDITYKEYFLDTESQNTKVTVKAPQNLKVFISDTETSYKPQETFTSIKESLQEIVVQMKPEQNLSVSVYNNAFSLNVQPNNTIGLSVSTPEEIKLRYSIDVPIQLDTGEVEEKSIVLDTNL